jgi:hypothetical protein
VPLFHARQATVVQSLTKSIRLLLPADPGPERMLDAVRQYNPAAKHALGGGICVDGGHFNLSSVLRVDAELAQEAGLSPDIMAAYFVNWQPTARGAERQTQVQRYREQAACLLSGLAARFGGSSVPPCEQAGAALHADVYTPRQVDAPGLSALVSRRVPALAGAPASGLDDRQAISMIARREPGDEREGRCDLGVVTVRGNGVPFGVEYWPPGIAVQPIMRDWTGGRSLAVLARLGTMKLTDLSMIVVRADQPTLSADPDVARAVAEAGLGLAADTAGICVDPFGFAVRSPDDLVFR